MSDACAQVDALRKEAANLQKQLSQKEAEVEDTERQHNELQMRYNEVKVANDEESSRYQAEQHEVKTLRKKKTDLTRKKDLAEKECQKQSQELQSKIAHRKELEAIALKLTAQLEQTSMEKQALLTEHDQNQVSSHLIDPAANDRRVQLRSQGPQAGYGADALGDQEHF